MTLEEFFRRMAAPDEGWGRRESLIESFERDLDRSRFYLDLYNMASHLFRRGEVAAAEALWLFLARRLPGRDDSLAGKSYFKLSLSAETGDRLDLLKLALALYPEHRECSRQLQILETDSRREESVAGDIVVIDSIFPMKVPFGFRNAEINGLFKRVPNFSSYTMYPMKPGNKAWFSHGYGMDEKTFLRNKAGYLKYYPGNIKKVRYLYPDQRYQFKLAYTYFVAETYTMLPFLEKNGIPFVFVLYPGGAFGLDNDSSDAMLSDIMGSRCFRKVITTQRVTNDYLVRKKFCASEKIEHLFGGFLQFDLTETDVPPKQYYKKEKDTFDICFVAAKYMPQGLDKGYDLFVETAKQLARRHDDLRFHVIGGFAENDIDVREIRDKISFYGFRQPNWLQHFYPKMDVCLGPIRPFQMYKGSFDGYPMGYEQSIFGVAMFTTDQLNNNDGLYDEDEIVHVQCEARDIVEKIEYYLNNLDLLYRLAEKGNKKTRQLFDTNERLGKIAALLTDLAQRE